MSCIPPTEGGSPVDNSGHDFRGFAWPSHFLPHFRGLPRTADERGPEANHLRVRIHIDPAAFEFDRTRGDWCFSLVLLIKVVFVGLSCLNYEGLFYLCNPSEGVFSGILNIL